MAVARAGRGGARCGLNPFQSRLLGSHHRNFRSRRSCRRILTVAAAGRRDAAAGMYGAPKAGAQRRPGAGQISATAAQRSAAGHVPAACQACPQTGQSIRASVYAAGSVGDGNDVRTGIAAFAQRAPGSQVD